MINAALYSELLAKITETAKQRADLEQFIANGGRYKLTIQSVESPEVAALLTEVFKTTRGFDVLLNTANNVLKNRENDYTQSFLNEASTTALSNELKEAAE